MSKSSSLRSTSLEPAYTEKTLKSRVIYLQVQKLVQVQRIIQLYQQHRFKNNHSSLYWKPRAVVCSSDQTEAEEENVSQWSHLELLDHEKYIAIFASWYSPFWEYQDAKIATTSISLQIKQSFTWLNVICIYLIQGSAEMSCGLVLHKNARCSFTFWTKGTLCPLYKMSLNQFLFLIWLKSVKIRW